MPRLFIPPEQMSAGCLRLRGADHHYLVHVLRRQAGDRVTLLDGRGRMAEAVIGRVDGQAADLVIDQVQVVDRGGRRITLMQGMLKGEKMDLVVQKATELGVGRIVPVLCERSVARPDPLRAAERRKRWERIAQGAAQQCRRADVPEVAPVLDLKGALSQAAEGLRLLPWEGALMEPLRDVLPVPLPAEITVLIGPEGGFSLEEVEQAGDAGFVPCGLGARVLRAETAALAVLAILGFVSQETARDPG